MRIVPRMILILKWDPPTVSPVIHLIQTQTRLLTESSREKCMELLQDLWCWMHFSQNFRKCIQRYYAIAAWLQHQSFMKNTVELCKILRLSAATNTTFSMFLIRLFAKVFSKINTYIFTWVVLKKNSIELEIFPFHFFHFYKQSEVELRYQFTHFKELVLKVFLV